MRSRWRSRGSQNGLAGAGVEVGGGHLQWRPPGFRDLRGTEKYPDLWPDLLPDHRRDLSKFNRGDRWKTFKEDLNLLYKEDLNLLHKEDH